VAMMGWISAAFIVIVAVCATLAAIHAHVWVRERSASANGAFAVLSIAVAAIAGVELAMMTATTPAAWGRALWWLHFPVLLAMAALVRFVQVTLKAGRPWLGWTALGLRGLITLINVFSDPNVNFREVTGIERVTLFGEVVSVGQGTASPWLGIAQLSLVVLLIFLADAAVTIWRRGERRHLLVIGAGLLVFVTASTGLAIVSFWGLFLVPIHATLFFLPIVLFMGYLLSLELVRAIHLKVELGRKSEALLGSERKLELAARAAKAGLWSVDLATGRLWGTPDALAVLGLSADRPQLARDILDAVHPDDHERLRGFLASATIESKPEAIEYRVTTPAGEVRWHEAHGAVHAGPTGVPMLMGATIDITERKRSEYETARQRIALEHLSRVATLSELSGAIAHELNQPLSIIMSNAEAAQQMLKLPAPPMQEIAAILTDIVKADERASAVIQRLRSLLKRGAPELALFPVNALVQSVLHFLRAEFVRRGVTVTVRLDAHAGMLRGDRVPLEQVLINLCNNACDAAAMNARGNRQLTVTTGRQDGEVWVSVADSGAGLPSATDCIFDAFYTTKPDGLGLGLTISRSIVAAHGGRIVATANHPCGAVLTVSLPVAPAES
jgi:two-component system sensor kinase FixL